MPYSKPVVFIYSTSVPINPCVMLNSELRRKLAFLFSRCCQSSCWAVLHAERAVAVGGWAEQLCSALLPGAWKRSSCTSPAPSWHRQLCVWQQIVAGVDKTGWGWQRLLHHPGSSALGISKCRQPVTFFLWIKLLPNVWICRDTIQLLHTPSECCRAACLSSQRPFSTRYQQSECKKRGNVPDSPISENCCDTHLHNMGTFKLYRVLSESGRVRAHTWYRMISSGCQEHVSFYPSACKALG